MFLPLSFDKLVELLKKLPSVGQKTAERYAWQLVSANPQYLSELSKAIINLKIDFKRCNFCNALNISNPCPICQDKNRDRSILCIVAETADIQTIENTKIFKGIYFVLGGLIDVIKNISPNDLPISLLKNRLAQNNIKEIIFAFDPNLSGETTANYLKMILQNKNIRFTKLARGLPNGASLEYADEITLTNSLKNRQPI